MMWWDKSHDVVSYEYEPFVFVLDNEKRTIPDFLVNYTDGHSEIIEIKPTALQNIQNQYLKNLKRLGLLLNKKVIRTFYLAMKK